jgi:hypothetical protein
MLDANSSCDFNVRADRYLVARTAGPCGYCRAWTPLIALVLPPYHDSLELNCNPFGGPEAIEEYVWAGMPHSAFLFYVEYLPEGVQRRLTAFSRSYRFAYSEQTLGSYWANHCKKCGSRLDDQDLFCEPEAAFLPTSAESASAIELVGIADAIEARAAGYAFEPEFFWAMARS